MQAAARNVLLSDLHMKDAARYVDTGQRFEWGTIACC